MSIKSTNPATNKVEKTFTEMIDADIDKAIAQSASTFEEWKKTSYKKRAEILHKVAGLLREKKKELAQMITLEMGKLVAQAEGEIKLSAEIFDYYASNAEAFLADKILHPVHGEALLRHSPIGVLLGVQPWNFPFYQVARFAAPNIMAGNTILLKHASIVP
ncbi:MAG: aldehyde dehydrogenase family protein, partial [Chitinophagaceae bacterium]|nr:aldehyde dehydrogenase family protein [Chitinophagaceae bacterium]